MGLGIGGCMSCLGKWGWMGGGVVMCWYGGVFVGVEGVDEVVVMVGW